jgi:molybdate transport system substrate-binding protein
MGDPQSVPAGKYGEQALEKLGLWAALEPHLARAESVRAALALVSRAEAPLGIVYATDAAADTGVRIAADFPPASYPPIIYPAALIKASTNAAAKPFLVYLASPTAAPFFTRQGFTRLGPPA